MNFKIGKLITHPILRKARHVRQIRTDSKGKLWIGIGKKTFGYLSADECQRYSKKGVGA